MTREQIFTALLAAALAGLIIQLVLQRYRHDRNLDAIPQRILINGIRGKSSVTRLAAGALRTDPDVRTIAKTTGTAARFIFATGKEEPIKRPAGIVNVAEQFDIIARAARLRAGRVVIECMAVDPDLQQLNTEKLIKPQVVVIGNVRNDHLDEMGGPERSLDNVARSLCRSMPQHGICITAERDRWDILAEEAAKRHTQLIYADPASITDAEMRHFDYITFPENVALALAVAQLYGITRQAALAGMYAAAPDPGVLRVDPVTFAGRRFAAVNLFAANDPDSTIMNLQLLHERGLIADRVSVVIGCRPDRIERNGQMGAIVQQLGASRVFLIGTPTKSAADHIPPDAQHLVVDLGGAKTSGADLLEAIAQHLPDDPNHALVMVGNIHGAGHELLHALEAATTADDELAALLGDTVVLPAVAPRITTARDVGDPDDTALLYR